MSDPWDTSGDLFRYALVDDSLWSHGLFRISRIAHADLLTYLGRHLAQAHSDILREPLPDAIAERLSAEPAPAPPAVRPSS